MLARRSPWPLQARACLCALARAMSIMRGRALVRCGLCLSEACLQRAASHQALRFLHPDRWPALHWSQ
eukprot:5448939-Pyramimonas_sp.AAC.1